MDATSDGHGWIMAAVDAHELPLGRYARRLLGDADLAADPAEVSEQRELAARLRDLPPPQREAIDLWCEGFTAKEIAAITGRTEGHVRVLTHRGLTTLRSHHAIRSLVASEPSTTGPA